MMQSLLGTFLEEGWCCKESILFTVFNSVTSGQNRGLERD